MKLLVLTTLASAILSTQNCDAFSTSRTAKHTVVALNAANSDYEEAFTVTRRAATASFLAALAVPLAAVAADTTLDFALPSYDPKMAGFGEGSEAYIKKGTLVKEGVTADKLMTDPGADEREKQRTAMAKAEEARKVALAKKKAEQKERDEESKRRAIEKKIRDKERLKNIWGDSTE